MIDDHHHHEVNPRYQKRAASSKALAGNSDQPTIAASHLQIAKIPTSTRFDHVHEILVHNYRMKGRQ